MRAMLPRLRVMPIDQPRARLGELLRGYREQRGLSQEELAQRAVPPLSTETVSNLERGRTRPYRHTVQAVCRALEFDEAARESVWAAWQASLNPRTSPIAPVRPRNQQPGNLPLQATNLVGREREVEQLSRRVRDQNTRLLTLVGPGGVGKTRLALAVAAAVDGQFADGIFFIDLSAVRDPQLVLSPFVRALNVRSELQSVRDGLIGELRHRRMLLVVDNFEQLLAAAGEMSELLAACADLTLLVTSREPLGVRWEHVFSVPPLALPSQPHSVTLEGLREVPSVALFVQRAQSADDTFALSRVNAAAVVAVCTAMDGLPLAIELAAARVRALPPNVLLAHLDQRLDLLTGPRDGPARQHSMRATLAWSYDLLEPAERALFRRLGVFAGDASLEAVVAVCPAGDRAQTLSNLAGLVDKYLVTHDSGSGAEPRYRLLDTVRAFALDQLTAAGERDDTAERHACYYLAIAEESNAGAVGTHLARLDREQDNTRAALGWFVQSADAERGQRLATVLVEFWSTRGYFEEAQHWFAEVLALPGWRSKLVRARALNAAGRLAWLWHECCGTSGVARPGARALYKDALCKAREADDAPTIAEALCGLGQVAFADGDLRHARAWFERALRLSQARGLDAATAVAQRRLGRLALEVGDLDMAEPYLHASLHTAQHTERHQDAGGTLSELGMLALQRGDDRLARMHFEESLAIFDKLNDRAQVAHVRLCLGIVALRGSDFAAALDHMTCSLELSQTDCDQHGMVEVLDGLACLAAAHGDIERAIRVYGAAQALRDKLRTQRSAFKQALVDAWLAEPLSHADTPLAAGRAMSLERAVELALATADVA